ncbi:hypothetical protein [Streptomyces cinerochromogenes]|uniref:hypothetical protein n=1 Tax=Streptomyces cinerochromogenes TaxID=66422 RepID=UPI00166FFC07|nr:hypothetical protein [Streptomyces cinerochromogenes]GGS78760.1 hypothetical protein GCM10010206_46500 [Streptomyces cinerochromogenes]
MIKAIGVTNCTAVETESDPYIPLTVTWINESRLQPLYWRITGEAGGELEIKVDPQSGAIRELVVIDEPPRTVDTGLPQLPHEAGTGIPVFDCSPWGDSTKPDYSDFRSRVITSSEAVSFLKGDDTATLLFTANQTARVLTCENVEIHLAGDGALSAVVVLARPCPDPAG